MARDSASPLERARVLAGRYQLDRELGRGGMGVVYRGVDLLMERPVAVKLLQANPNPEHPGTRRFLAEAKNAARIQHEHVIQVFDVGTSEAGEPFFVMELIEGASLSDLLKKAKRFAPARVAAIGDQICEALHAAHKAGIVHRDLKLANVLLASREGEGDFVKLIDFGISRADDRARGLTNAGEVVGTLAYMAPEQILHAPIDGRTDVYALGGVLYRLLTGVPVFRDGTVSALVQDHLHTVPVPPHERAPDAGIPEAVSAVVVRCLAKRPRDRFASARAAGFALRRALDPEGVGPDSAPPSSRGFIPGPDPAVFDTLVAPSEAGDGGPMSSRLKGRPAATRPIRAPNPEPADSTLATRVVPDEEIEGEATQDGASVDELPPSESGSRRTPPVALARRAEATARSPIAGALVARAELPAPRAPQPARGRVPLPIPSEPPPSSRGSRVARPPPEPSPPPSMRAPASVREGGREPPASARPPRQRVPAYRAPEPPTPARTPPFSSDPPSGTRPSPPGGRAPEAAFELAELPRSVRAPPLSTGDRCCSVCNAGNERYARLCRACGEPLDPSPPAELRRDLTVSSAAPPTDRPSSPLGAAAGWFAWAPPILWRVLAGFSLVVLVVGELTLKRPGVAFPIVLGALVALGGLGMAARR